eukprot:TRINITY_DN3642_c0_g2_i1.p1 TRINITY_DN3642_c0_g2~~TRINITY_DN3642_c0_g2_i1.p1  ORF type:complete len:140 (-),score=14.93 TRINITY_DN3642_c0_g2_i1:54-473(-)
MNFPLCAFIQFLVKIRRGSPEKQTRKFFCYPEMDDKYNPLGQQPGGDKDPEYVHAIREGLFAGGQTALMWAAVPSAVLFGMKKFANPLYLRTVGRVHWQATLIAILLAAGHFGYAKATLTMREVREGLSFSKKNRLLDQ